MTDKELGRRLWLLYTTMKSYEDSGGEGEQSWRDIVEIVEEISLNLSDDMAARFKSALGPKGLLG